MDPKLALRGIKAWSTMFFVSHWPRQREKGGALIELLQRKRAMQREPVESGIATTAKSSQGLYESHFDLFQDPNEALQELVVYIRSAVAAAVAIANDHAFSAANLEIDFPDSWYHITNGGGFHDAHLHHGCSWCGIFYLQVGQSDGPGKRSEGAPNGGSRFYSPLDRGGSYRDAGNRYLVPALDLPIEDGLLLIFPSYLLHSGLPYQGGIDRMVIAFNAQCFLKEGAP
jgi:uncharacterized protein (TIGR02466 family)